MIRFKGNHSGDHMDDGGLCWGRNEGKGLSSKASLERCVKKSHTSARKGSCEAVPPIFPSFYIRAPQPS